MPDSTMTIAGSLGSDPDLRYTASGRAVGSFSVAVSHRYQVNNEWQSETSWVPVTVWGDLAEHVAESCTKGTRVICSGRVKEDSWEDRETGQKRSKLQLTADDVGVSLKWATATVARTERTTAPARSGDVTGQTELAPEEPF